MPWRGMTPPSRQTFRQAHSDAGGRSERQAQPIARWMGVGFIHGRTPTPNNMSISGETIDYGPCGVHGGLIRATVFSLIDRRGRYAYAGQQ